MAFMGFYDAVSLALSLKLLLLAIAAACTDNWHPAFFLRDLGPSLVLVMVLIFTGALLAAAGLVAMCLTVFLTEGARTIACVLSGFSAFVHTSMLLMFACSLVGLAGPWLLAMLNSALTMLTAHLVLIHLKKLENCPLVKLALSSVLLFMSVLCVSLSHWWAVETRAGPGDLPGTVGLFSLPSGVGASLVQAFAVLLLLSLVGVVAVFAVAVAVTKAWIAADPFGDVLSARLGLGLSATGLLCSLVATIAYSTVTHYTDSMLAAVCLCDSGLCMLYQLLGSNALPTQ